jgi:hypothetical protein
MNHRTLVLIAALSGCSADGTTPEADLLAPDGTRADIEDAKQDAAPADVALTDTVVADAAQPSVDSATDAGFPDSASVDAAPPADAGPAYLVLPVSGCQPAGDPCKLGTPVQTLFAGYRKDYYLPSYVEQNPPPLYGGRFHIAGVSAATGKVTAVKIDGLDLEQHLEDSSIKHEKNLFEWFHVWPSTVTAGEPVWVAFHSRDPKWDAAKSGKVTVETVAGAALSGAFPVQKTKLPLTYVTTTEDRKQLLIHSKNEDSAPHVLKRILVNGRDVTQVACVPDKNVPAKTAVLWTVPLCKAAKPGEPWTVVVEYTSGETAVGVGRIIKPFFILEAWNNTTQCPFPGGNASNYKTFIDAGLDTTYIHYGVGSSCNVDLFKLIENVMPQTGGIYTLTSSGVGEIFKFTNTKAMAGFLTGDESDKNIYNTDQNEPSYGKPNAWHKAKKSKKLWAKYPGLPTYNGAMTNRHVGTFAGMADIQGIDYYIAACAPHITQVFTKFEITTSYDYLKNARDNHMPGPTWLYSQGLHKGWNTTHPILGHEIHVQPDPQELLIQGMSVVAAGGKGLMWFQIAEQEIKHSPARWDAISRLTWMVRGVRHLLREGDITGMIASPKGTLVELVRAREALVVVVINTEVKTKVDDTCNALKYVSEASVPHWIVADHKPDIAVPVPAEMGVLDLFEVRDRKAHDLTPAQVSVSGRTVTLKAVPLTNSDPVRLFVLAADHKVRARVVKEMK